MAQTLQRSMAGMQLTGDERAMLDGVQGDARRIAMEGLVQLGAAFGAEDMVEIGYAHIHAGMALYLHDVVGRG